MTPEHIDAEWDDENDRGGAMSETKGMHPDDAAAGWEWDFGVTCVVCPACAFTFDADHTDSQRPGRYTCPNCTPTDSAPTQEPEPVAWREAVLDVVEALEVTTTLLDSQSDDVIDQRQIEANRVVSSRMRDIIYATPQVEPDKMTVSEIAEAAQVDPVQVSKVVWALIDLGALKLHGDLLVSGYPDGPQVEPERLEELVDEIIHAVVDRAVPRPLGRIRVKIGTRDAVAGLIRAALSATTGKKNNG